MSSDGPKKTWKLNAQDIDSIIDLAQTHGLSTQEIAARKMVSTVSIWRILARHGGILKGRRRVDPAVYADKDLAIGVFLARTNSPKISWQGLATKLVLPLSAIRVMADNGKREWLVVSATEREARKTAAIMALANASVTEHAT